MTRYGAYSSRSDFDLVIAYHGDRPIGQTWGWPLNEKTAWWNGLSEEPEPGFTQENGRRTFALSEFMVVHDWTGKESLTDCMTCYLQSVTRNGSPC